MGLISGHLLLLMASLPALEASEAIDESSPFYYYWETLQLAGVLCLVGIAFVLSNECKCKTKKEQSPVPESAVPFIVPGSVRT
ncbi:FXYD domain-containing ion transport regulator 4-like [Erinaceus europaeus]|uniref:FXYD domain-containing ion transport regulator n=1 Tax=Erinaceus europaeus TaxID=9365 RepID=A0ABM3YIZ0_ERIEU|nr:FXYD domain-containing ion transport regulator 4-like [Erinaceus europaeus]